MFIDSRYFY